MAKRLYVYLHNFEGSGKTAKVSIKALTEKRETKIAGRVGKRFQKQLIRRNNANKVVDSGVEKE